MFPYRVFFPFQRVLEKVFGQPLTEKIVRSWLFQPEQAQGGLFFSHWNGLRSNKFITQILELTQILDFLRDLLPFVQF